MLWVETLTKGTCYNLNLSNVVKNAHQIKLHLLPIFCFLTNEGQPRNKIFLLLSHPTLMFDYIWHLSVYAQIQYSCLQPRWSEEKQRTQKYSKSFVCSVFLSFFPLFLLSVCIISNDKCSPPGTVVNPSKLLFNS